MGLTSSPSLSLQKFYPSSKVSNIVTFSSSLPAAYRDVLLRLPGHTFFVLGRMSADGRVGLEAPDHAKAADRGSREDLSFWLAEIFHLLPGALLIGGVLVLAPSLIERGVPYEIA